MEQVRSGADLRECSQRDESVWRVRGRVDERCWGGGGGGGRRRGGGWEGGLGGGGQVE